MAPSPSHNPSAQVGPSAPTCCWGGAGLYSPPPHTLTPRPTAHLLLLLPLNMALLLALPPLPLSPLSPELGCLLGLKEQGRYLAGGGWGS